MYDQLWGIRPCEPCEECNHDTGLVVDGEILCSNCGKETKEAM